MCLKIICSLLSCFKVLRCEVCIDFCVYLGCHCHNCSKITRCRCGYRADNKFFSLFLRHYEAREVSACYLVVNAAFGILHLEQPVELEPYLIENIGNAVAGLGDAEIIVECLRIE